MDGFKEDQAQFCIEKQNLFAFIYLIIFGFMDHELKNIQHNCFELFNNKPAMCLH